MFCALPEALVDLYNKFSREGNYKRTEFQNVSMKGKDLTHESFIIKELLSYLAVLLRLIDILFL